MSSEFGGAQSSASGPVLSNIYIDGLFTVTIRHTRFIHLFYMRAGAPLAPLGSRMAVELESERPIAVAIVAPSLAILGGQAVQARRLLDAWTNDPDVHAWLVPINPEPPRWLRWTSKIKYIRTLVTQFTYWPQLARELRRADVVHVFSASYFSFLLAPYPAVLAARMAGRPVLMNYRSGEAPDHLQRSPLARRTLRAVAGNVVPSRFLQEVFASHRIEARVIPNIIDRERFAFRLRDPLRPRLLSTRNFESLYNVECTLRAFARVQQRWPDATLTLVGGGSEEGALRHLADELKLRGVTFAGRVAPDEIWRHYADADIYVQTPDIDNMPSSVLEAYASGLPVVSTNVGGIPAILTDGVHGLLAPARDHEAIASHVLRLLDDDRLARRLALAGFDATEDLAWDRVRVQWLDVYRGLLPNPVRVSSALRSAS
jgi:glycosyltransferase involved in cell wall biosynthesis